MRPSGAATRGIVARAGARHLAQDGNLGQAGSDVIVQVTRNSRAHSLGLEQSRDPVPMTDENQQRQANDDAGAEPPPLPHRRQNDEIHGSGRDAGQRRRW